MASINFTDPNFYRMKPDPTAVVDNAFSSLAAPNIMLGFLDTAGKNDAASLRNAIQATDNAGNARERASLDSLSQSERELASQVHQQQQAKYNADSNARMQLLQKSNEISENLQKLRGEYGFDENSPKDKVRLQNYQNQKEQITKQLEAATQAVMNNPLYQGETLVAPISDSYSNTASQEPSNNATEQAQLLDNFIHEKLKDLDVNGLIKLNEEAIRDEFKNKYPNTGFNADDISKRILSKRDRYKQERIALDEEEIRRLKLSEDRRQAELSKKDYDNKKIQLAIESYAKNAELQAIAAKSQSSNEFIQNLPEGLKVFAKQDGLDNANLKAVFNLIKGLNDPPATTPPKKAKEGKYAN